MSCTWTEKLQEISNPDKHRTLRGIAGKHDVKVDVNESRSTLAKEAGIIRSATTADGTTLFLRFQMETAIFFDDGSPAISNLNEIKGETERTLARFKGEFP